MYKFQYTSAWRNTLTIILLTLYSFIASFKKLIFFGFDLFLSTLCLVISILICIASTSWFLFHSSNNRFPLTVPIGQPNQQHDFYINLQYHQCKYNSIKIQKREKKAHTRRQIIHNRKL